jgi:hypothetical protein
VVYLFTVLFSVAEMLWQSQRKETYPGRTNPTFLATHKAKLSVSVYRGLLPGEETLGKIFLPFPRVETLIVQPMGLNFVPTRMWIISVYVASMKTGTAGDPHRGHTCALHQYSQQPYEQTNDGFE